ncbi:hypothetical protein Fmac_014836 [Flemingia macrophylla]|uniref:(S)-hydroxynitrile lyase n=1 Tax=Flemingia macrophylla TaxID=520843 RepID=A0ABD1MCV5_9FABA
MSSGNCMNRKHYVLVHGAWCWDKLKPLLETSGHHVTLLDLAASGTNMKKIEDVDTFSVYSEPLLELLATLPPNEKVILIGHSLGGLNIALAMDKFPDKVAVGVFLTAFVPDTEHKPSYVVEKCIESTPKENWLDSKFSQRENKSITVFGHKFLSNKLYQACSVEDQELAKTLIRPGSLFIQDLSQQKTFSKQGYGSVPLAFIVCTEDLANPLKFQLWMIQNVGTNVDVLEIKGADHMAMLSKPHQLCDFLLHIATKYA